MTQDDKPNELTKLADLRGIMPPLPEGMTSEEAVRKVREGWNRTMNDKPQGLMSAEALAAVREWWLWADGLPPEGEIEMPYMPDAVIDRAVIDIPRLLAHIAALTEERDHYRAAYMAERGAKEYAERELLAKDE